MIFNPTIPAVLLLSLLLLSPFLFAGSPAEEEDDTGFISVPGGSTPSPFYVSNRPPLLLSPLVKLPIGSITPRGWLLGQLEREASGMFGRLPEISPFLKKEGNSWLSPDGEGHSPWEEVPYWLKGFGDLAYVLKDEALLAEARLWIDAILSSQDERGWFGPRRNLRHHDIWPNMIALNCLQSFYEATGDARVLPFMTRYFRFLHDMPREHLLPGSWQKIRGGDNLESIYWLYNRTGDAFLLDLAEANHARTADWAGSIASWHGVNICQCFREPGEYYLQAKDSSLLNAVTRNYDEVMSLYGQVPGGMFGADENCRRGYYGPRQAAEACSMVEFMHSFEMLIKITGLCSSEWGDRCEEVAFNSLPAALTPDLKALHYLTAPNMVLCDGENKAPGLQNRGCMLAFTPHRYRCCQHNVSHGWPYFAEELWLATEKGGLCASLYAPCEVTARVGDGTEVTIREETDYPFGETIRFTLSLEKETAFPLYLRVPGWSRSMGLSINNSPAKLRRTSPGYLILDRTWKDGDSVEFVLPMEVETREWGGNGSCLSVRRGPLWYALKIGEDWRKYSGDEEWKNHEKADVKATAEWPAWEVYPSTPWNYGLELDGKNPARSFEVVRRDRKVGEQPFVPDGSPVELRVRARRIPRWKMEYGLVGAMQPGPVRSDEAEETITLIPMGCARLRITAFPVIGHGPGAREWAVPLEPRASHCFDGDTVRALNDGIEPESSGDREIPRMTWWDHCGTAEWVACDFGEKRKVSGVDVYWFDDRGTGRCRVPASWRVLRRDGETWRPVKKSTPRGTERDRYNSVDFELVATTGLKLEVQLQEGFSGGILEWRIR
jgi:hypothetical protein